MGSLKLGEIGRNNIEIAKSEKMPMPRPRFTRYRYAKAVALANGSHKWMVPNFLKKNDATIEIIEHVVHWQLIADPVSNVLLPEETNLTRIILGEDESQVVQLRSTQTLKLKH